MLLSIILFLYQLEISFSVGTLDGRVPGVMAKEFKKTLKNFKRDPEMDKYVESPFNPFNEASEMTGICFDIVHTLHNL